MTMEGKVVVLTGAAGGIGQVLVERFLAEGAHVVASDLDEAKLAALTAAVGASPRLATVAADVGDEASCRALADTVRALHGRVDVLVNNAGWFPTCEFRDMRYADWQAVLRVNLDAVFLMTTAMLPLIEGRGWGRIVNIGSGSVFKGVASQVHYVSAKAGVVGFTRSLAKVLGPHGITVNIVAPGLTATSAAVAIFGAAAIGKRSQERAIPRDQQPRDVAGAVLFLASDGADFITGQTLLVDGGGHMH